MLHLPAGFADISPVPPLSLWEGAGVSEDTCGNATSSLQPSPSKEEKALFNFATYNERAICMSSAFCMSGDCTLAAATTLEELQCLVHVTLCRHDRLEPRQTPLLRGVIKRAGQPCGLFFQVEGPRLMKNYAVWAGEENRVICYDSSGWRFKEIRLSKAPDPKKLAAS